MSDSDPFAREMAAIPNEIKLNRNSDDGRKWAIWEQKYISPYQALHPDAVARLAKLDEQSDRHSGS